MVQVCESILFCCHRSLVSSTNPAYLSLGRVLQSPLPPFLGWTQGSHLYSCLNISSLVLSFWEMPSNQDPWHGWGFGIQRLIRKTGLPHSSETAFKFWSPVWNSSILNCSLCKLVRGMASFPNVILIKHKTLSVKCVGQSGFAKGEYFSSFFFIFCTLLDIKPYSD